MATSNALAPLRLSSYTRTGRSFARTSLQLQSRCADSRQRRRKSMLASIAVESVPKGSWFHGTTHRDSNMLWQNSAMQKRCGTSVSRPTNEAVSKQALKDHSAMPISTEHRPSTLYTTPTTGIISYLPKAWVPYAELIRLDKPTGTYYLFLPCLFSTLIAAPLTDPMSSPLTVLGTSALFFTGALIMRGAGCTVNDLWDRNLDPHVERTKLRPIARGAITVRQAIPFLGVQLLTGLAILLQFPTQCLYYGIPSLVLVATYPLAKRVTNYPQFVLGLTFSWGAIMGFPALGIDLLSHTPALISAACLYSSCVAWTVVYDMIYAYQDIKDDAAAGIKSIALAQERNAKAFLTTVASVQVVLLAGAGVAVSAGPMFFVGACGGAAGTLGYMLWKVNLKSVEDCWAWFKKGAWFTGSAISVGLFLEYMAQYFGLYEEEVAPK